MYWSLMTLTTIGERPPPETDLVSQPFIAIFDIFSKLCAITRMIFYVLKLKIANVARH